MITGFSHVSIVVPDIEAAARMLADRFGLSVGERMVNEQQGVRLAYVDLAGGKIELMEPSRSDSPDREISRAQSEGRHPPPLAESWRHGTGGARAGCERGAYPWGRQAAV